MDLVSFTYHHALAPLIDPTSLAMEIAIHKGVSSWAGRRDASRAFLVFLLLSLFDFVSVVFIFTARDQRSQPSFRLQYYTALAALSACPCVCLAALVRGVLTLALCVCDSNARWFTTRPGARVRATTHAGSSLRRWRSASGTSPRWWPKASSGSSCPTTTSAARAWTTPSRPRVTTTTRPTPRTR